MSGLVGSMLGVAPTFEVGSDIDATAIVTAVGAAGAIALVAALGAGACFVIGKKTFRWIMGKI